MAGLLDPEGMVLAAGECLGESGKETAARPAVAGLFLVASAKATIGGTDLTDRRGVLPYAMNKTPSQQRTSKAAAIDLAVTYNAFWDVEEGYKQAAKAALEATGVEVNPVYAGRGWSIGLNLRSAGGDHVEVESYSLRYIGGGALRSIERAVRARIALRTIRPPRGGALRSFELAVRPTPEAVLEAVTRIQQFNTEAEGE